MKKQLFSLLLCLCMAFSLLPTAVLAATPNVLSIKITMTTPEAGKPLPTTAKTSKNANYEVTKVEWSGATDSSGNMAYDTVYTAVFTVEIKKGKDTKFSTAAAKEFVKNATMNGEYKGFTGAEKVSDTMVKLTYELPAVNKPSTTISKLDNIHLIVPSVGYAPDKSGYTDNKAKVKVTETKWSGEVDSYGLAIAGVSYVYTFSVEIKPEYDLTFSTGTIKATINSKSDGVTVQRVSDTKAIVTCVFPALAEKEKPAADKSKTFTKAQADAAYPLANPITLLISEETIDMEALKELAELPLGHRGSFYQAVLNSGAMPTYTTLDGDVINNKDLPDMDKAHGNFNTLNYYRVNRIVYDVYYPDDDATVCLFDNAKELWLSPKCDIMSILKNLEQFSLTAWPYTFKTYDYTVFIPDSVFPNGPDYRNQAIAAPPGCRVMLYSGGDVYAAAEKGASAARDWCTNHNFNSTPDNFDGTSSMIGSRDRIYTWGSCQTVRRYYYSCNRCAKCEYNPNHTWVGMDIGNDRLSAHQYTVKTVSDEHFLGINAQGDRVYLTCCETCGKDQKQVALATTYDYYKNVMGMDGDYSYYQLYMEKEKKSWSPGGTAYEMRMKATPEKDYLDGYVVTADHFVTARTSGWATQSVQAAANDGLADKALLGGDYTGTVNRLQFCSIAVKMAEKMTGKPISPAPLGTFTDTDSEYVRKASAAGITTGVGEGLFDPNGPLTRQQMATFLYRALMYVKANSDTEYTVYTSKLGSYSDAGQIQDWAKQPMEFMNALGLIAGTSGTTLSPNANCTIEQALIVADRSLDAGGIGWYQYISDEMGAYSAPGVGYFTYGERIWFTSSNGDCVDPNGVACTVPFQYFYPIKDR